MFLHAGCSEVASGQMLAGICCDGLKYNRGIIAIVDGWKMGTFKSCNDHVQYEEYVRDACPKTCGGKLYMYYLHIPMLDRLKTIETHK